MMRRMKKICISILTIMMVVTQVPAPQLTYAKTNEGFEINQVDNEESKKIELLNIKEEIIRVDLFLNDNIIDTKVNNEGLSFDIYSNGTYVIKGYDEKERLIGQESIHVSSFKNFTIEEDISLHQVNVQSRYPQTQSILVNEEVIEIKQKYPGYYEANYILPENGEYTFSIVDKEGTKIESKTLSFNSIPRFNEEGHFIIRSEEDINQMIQHPSRTFVLENDIELTTNALKDIHFTGSLEGNGYTMSGFTGSLFNRIENATINNIVIKGALANTSVNSTITHTGFYVEASDNKKDGAVILKSDNTTIKNSFVLMNVVGKIVSGFILEGTGTIESSYVSGYLKGEEVYGFGKEVDVRNSYITASLIGETRTLFTNGNIEACFYDAQINDVEELKALPMYTKDMISEDFIHDEFKIIEGQYPQIKNIEEMKESSQIISTLSVQSVKTESNLSTLKGKVEVEEIENVKWKRSTKEISAKSDDIINRFALKEAKTSNDITVGESINATTTQIIYPITMGKYYKVSETEETLPTSHKEAIDNGWSIMYWTGSYAHSGLKWNTKYNVYSTDLINVTTDGIVTTNYGINGGQITLTGTYDENETMTATLSETNTTKGTMYFESADTLNATTWEIVETTPMDGTGNSASYTVTSAFRGKYLRARFEPDQTTGYEGMLIATTENLFKEEITSVIIKNTSLSENFTLNDMLEVEMEPAGKESDVVFKWFHDNGTEPIATGLSYTIKGSDVEKLLFVRAEPKTDGNFKNSKDSTLTSPVQSIKNDTPTAINQLKEDGIEDITVTLTMNVTEGLYRYGYSASKEATSIGDITLYPIPARNNTKTTITGLKPNTTYYFYVQRVGENGYSDSDWSSDYITIKTDSEHVKGDVVVSGDTIYNQTLTASLINNPKDQTGEFVWYRLDNDGNKTVIKRGTIEATYTLVTEDVNCRIEVAYEGNGSYAGKISTITDRISKEEVEAPTTNLTVTNHDDTTITVKMPNNSTGEKYILGISQSKNGVPVERLDGETLKVLASEEGYTITGLERDTTYFLYVRYAENETHQKSDWIDSTNAISQKTNTKDFKGTIEFTYETDKLIKGQTLTANLKPEDASFNYKGEWTWTRIEGSNETSINNFALTNDKKGTKYVVPVDETLNVTYKVTFTANVGYTGSVNNTSTQVCDIEKGKYENPIADDIVMEAIDDTSIKVKMDSGEGKYHFWYKEKDQSTLDSIKGFFNKLLIDPNDGFIDTEKDVLANVDVVIEGLKRNTEYIVRVQRVEDDKHIASDFTYSTDKSSDTLVLTNKTDIAGYVTIEGITRYDETLTATYNEASYASTGSGSDEDGTWQWYRGATPITNAKSDTYILKQEDIDEILTAKYTMPDTHSFTGEVEATTDTIQKALGVSPTIEKIESKEVDSKMIMTATLDTTGNENIYYRLQVGTDVPQEFPTLDKPDVLGWTKVTNQTLTIDKDGDNAELKGNTYTLHFIKIATLTEEATPILSTSHTVGKPQQTGKIEFEKLLDSKQAFVVDQTVKAKLSDGNSTVGTWKWYKSTKKYNGSDVILSPDSTSTTDWVEITSGFSQTGDNKVSSLYLSADLFGYFIRAEFIASNDSKYAGSISSTESQYVRKIYDERLRMTSSSKDGKDNPRVYQGTVITGTVENYAEEGNLNRGDIQIYRSKDGNDTLLATVQTNGIKENTFTYTATSFPVDYDGYEITVRISTPKIIDLYVDKDLKTMTSTTIHSDTSTKTSATLIVGMAINTPDDLVKFMKAESPYNDGNNTVGYVITDDIDMSGCAKISAKDLRGANNKKNFNERLNGDYHTILNLKNEMMFLMEGTSDKPAIVKNIIIQNANIEPDLSGLTATTDFRNAGIVADNVKGHVQFENLFLINPNLTSSTSYTGSIFGRAATGLTGKVNNCGTVGGSIIGSTSRTTGGLAGSIGQSTVTNCFTIGTEMSGKNQYSIGRTSTTTVQNYYTANIYTNFNTSDRWPFGSTALKNSTNYYYDQSISKVSKFFSEVEKGKGKNTSEMVSSQLDFGTTDWLYAEGYYPRLKWIADNPITKLYTTTRMAFTSVDEATSNDMSNRLVYAPIQIPAELQAKGFTVRSTNENIFKVMDGGTIVPVGNPDDEADIIITYTNEAGSTSKDFRFKVKNKVNAMSNVSIVDASTNTLTTAPKMDQNLSVNSAPASASYQWYRRQNGTTKSLPINGATNETYTVQPGDVGYELCALVKANGYASTYTSFTEAAVSITPTAPVVSNITDHSVSLKVSGEDTFKYEFGYKYANSNDTIKLVDGTHANNATIVADHLQRNRAYEFYVRIAKAIDNRYPASEWSSVTTQSTLKTAITGKPKLGLAINNGSALSLNMETTNGQTGTWTVDRMNADGVTVNTGNIASNLSGNTTSYTLTNEDIGYCIRATFTGSGDFEGSSTSEVSDIIQKTSNNTKPYAPTHVESTDTSIVVKMPSGGPYDISYATSATGEKVDGPAKVTGENVTISDLSRNKDYYIFIRSSETESHVASPWSDSLYRKTNRTSINPVTRASLEVVNPTVGESITFNPPSIEGVTGIWRLERVKRETLTTTVSFSKYEVNDNLLTYTVDPKDANATLKATFTGTGDFIDSVSNDSNKVLNASQDIENMPTGIAVNDLKDYSFKVKANDGTDTYQFGYAKKDETNITTVEATVSKGIDVLIDGLTRNTEYDIYIRKAAKQGYDASEWVKSTLVTTDRSALTGTVEYVILEGESEKPAKVGVANVGTTYKAKYNPGTYDQQVDDTNVGHWQWYADENEIKNATRDTYTIEPMTNVNDITVRFIANEASDFKDYSMASIGTLTKPAYKPPTTLPTVNALKEDGDTGSKLKIESTDVENVFYYVQKEENTNVPATVLASSAETNELKADQWFKATDNMTLNLEANTSYVVYVARLEDGSHISSGVISQRAEKTVKDDISQINSISIAETDNTHWKVLQDKELRIHRDNTPVDGVWQYYVSQTKDNSSWQNVTAEVKAKSTEGNTYTYTKVNVPLKYANGYYVRAVFTGRGDLEGSKTYTSTEPLIGTEIKGKVALTSTSGSKVFDTITVNYEVTDETNGVWSWYRIENETATEIKTGTVGITDQYVLTAEDVGNKIYATYTAREDGIYSGSVTSDDLDGIALTDQNTPNDITVRQISGTNVEINLPTNMRLDGKTIAQAGLEYRIKGEEKWNENGIGNPWITNLKANTEYEVRVLFEGTSEYKASEYGNVLLFQTDKLSFDVSKLSITQPETLEAGSKITATYTGSGYDEGDFILKRSDGTTINTVVKARLKRGFLFIPSSATIEYTITSEDIGQNIIVEFKAKDDAATHGGMIAKSTKVVEKPINITTQVETPSLNTVQYNEKSLTVEVNEAYEYVLNESANTVSETSSDWIKLTKDTDQRYHTFTGLDSEKEYYLHVRIAETKDSRCSKEAVSVATKPYQRKRYTITYIEIDKATNENPKQYYDVDGERTLQDASKNGYTFKGWTTGEMTEAKKGLTIPAHSTKDMTFTAHWEIITYNIEYNGGGMFANENPKTYNIESETITLTNPTRDGYDFTGWTYSGETTPQMGVTIPKGSFENKEYTANWTPISYGITYKLEDGENATSNPENYTIENNDIVLQEPTRKGYTFEGWTYEGETTPKKEVTISKGTFGEKEYTANWKTITYDITYNLDDGTNHASNPKKYTIESNPITLQEPTRTGYDFTGWTGTGIEGETAQKEVVILKGSFENREYTANWTPISYGITYKLEGGENPTSNPKDYTIESELITLQDPTRKGYTFEGWTYSGQTTPQKVVTIATGTFGEKEYTANWKTITYDITYNLDDGTNHTSNPENYTIESNPITLLEPTKTGYTFEGWSGTGIEGTSKSVEIAKGSTEARTYTANWEAIEYKINYNLDHGTNPKSNPEDYTIETSTFTLQEPTRVGYTFIGWSGTDISVMSKEVKIEIGSIGVRKFKANWSINTYTIGYELDHGTITGINPDKYTVETEDFRLENPTRKGYTFTGWLGTNLVIPSNSVTIIKGSTENKFYTASWLLNTYKIKYVLDEGVNHAENLTEYTVESDDITLGEPTKVGYTFMGWTYSEQDVPIKEVKILKGTIGDKEYTANWEAIEYGITYNLDDGTNSESNPKDYTIENDDIVLQEPTKIGYTFAGWTYEGETNPQKIVTIPTGSIGVKEYTANWTAIEYKINYYELEDGENPTSNPKDYTIESELITLQDPTRKGYTFEGWTYSGQTTPQKVVTIAKGSTGVKEYTANWTPITYDITYNLDHGTNSESNPKDYTIENDDIVLQEPTKTGYTFEGWTYEGETTPQKVVTIPQGTFGVKEYTANWKAIEYKINYNLDHGTNHASNPEDYTIETSTFTLQEPTRVGYTFIGWSGTDILGMSKEVKIEVGSIGVRNFKANWSINTYTIGYELDYGTITGTNPDKYTVETEDFTLKNPTRKGYTFTGWLGTNLVIPSNSVTIIKGSTENKFYTASWLLNTYKIKYVLDEGVNHTENLTKYTVESDDITLMEPTKVGYTFMGWTYSEQDVPTKEVNILKGTIGDKEYTANWEAIEYGITYNLDDGTNSESNPKDYTIENDDIVLQEPTKIGYTFAGWTYEGETNPQKIVTIPTGSIGVKEYTANWTAIEYKIKYVLDEGVNHAENLTEYTVESDDITLMEPTKVGYTFMGWTYSEQDVPTKEVKILKGTIGDKEYTANWEAITYDIIYHLDSGKDENHNPTQYTIEFEDIVLKEPTREGYTFIGWTGTDILEMSKDVFIESGSIGKREFTANWEANIYDITYGLDEGVNHVSNPKTYKITDDDIVLKAPSRVGHTFEGWKLNDEETLLETVTIESGSFGHVSISAVWKKINYKVIFDSQGGSVIEESHADYQDKVGEPAEPIREGYTFGGWYTEEECENVWNFDSDVIENETTLYAKWTINQYTAVFDGNEGSHGIDITVDYNTKLGPLPISTRLGYTFDGWYTEEIEGEEVTQDTLMPVDGVTYYAHWIINQYTVSFDANGGDEVSEIIKKDFDSELETLPTPTRAGYDFMGWFTAIDSEEEITSTSRIPAQDVIYYAKWQIIQYDIHYEFDEGVINSPANKSSYTIEDESFVLEVPSYLGHVFIGWTYGDIMLPEMKVSIPKGSLGELTFKANWEVSDYTVTFDSQKGSQVENLGAKHGGLVPEPVDPIRTGYVFRGWYTDTNFVTAWNFEEDVVTMDRILYAKWDIVHYDIDYNLNDNDMDQAINDPGNRSSYTIEDETFELKAPSYPGFVFIGWTYENMDTPKMDVTIEKGSIGKLSYKAHWETSDYTVSFDSQGGSKVESLGAKKEGLVSEPSHPLKMYYDFKGWYKDIELTQAWNFDEDIVLEDMTLFAKWEATHYKISYELDGGINHEDNIEDYTYESKDMTLKAPSKAHYVFIGWASSTIHIPQKEIVIEKGSFGDRSYKAHYTRAKYQVSFNTQGGNEIEDQILEYESLVKEPKVPYKEGYTFVSWYTDKSLIKSWDFETQGVEEDFVLYAKYVENLKPVTSDKSPLLSYNKGDYVQLFAENKASIYYTIDGSEPMMSEECLYKEPILLDKAITIKAIAVKEGYGQSSTSIFEFKVRGNGTIIIDENLPIEIINERNEIIEAVLTESEYDNYLYGEDTIVRIECNEIEESLDERIKKALDGRIAVQYYDITIYKTIANEKEVEVTQLRKNIQMILEVPQALYPPKGVTRIFNVLRIHDNKATLLDDIDKNENTVTFESDEFSTYILCYKDIIEDEPETPSKPILPELPNIPPIGEVIPSVGANTSQGEVGTNPNLDEEIMEENDPILPEETYKEIEKNSYNIKEIISMFLILCGIGGCVVLGKKKKNT